MRFSRQSRGFTLVELLVVMATLGVLIALLLPAVSSVLESARRMTCASHLHQIGLALNGYSSHRHTFPVGCSGCTWGVDRKHHSWVTEILSRMDRPELQSRYNFDHAYDSDENREVGGEILPFLLCPSTKTTKRIGFTTGDKNSDQQWDA